MVGQALYAVTVREQDLLGLYTPIYIEAMARYRRYKD